MLNTFPTNSLCSQSLFVALRLLKAASSSTAGRLLQAQSLTITIEEGTALNLSVPSSTELYAIILAAQLLGSKNFHGTIYTDYLEAVTVAHNPSLLRSMSCKANLPLYSFLINYLALNPGIRLAHVKAHGPSLKMD